MKKHPTLIPAFRAQRAESNILGKLTFFVIAFNIRGSPDSGAKENSWQPAAFNFVATSKLIPSLRVPDGN